MLAGPGDRLQAALRLAREGRAPFLLVSRGNQGYGGPCPPPVPHVQAGLLRTQSGIDER